MTQRQPAWSDLKVAFDFSPCIPVDDILGAVWDDVDALAQLLPEGWELVEEDRTGSRCVLVFRVVGVPGVDDSHAVQAVISMIEKGEDPRLPQPGDILLEGNAVALSNLPYGSVWKNEREWFLDAGEEVEVVDDLVRLAGEYGGRDVEEFTSTHDLGRAYAVPEHPDYVIFPAASGKDPRMVLLAQVAEGSARAVGGVEDWGLYLDAEHRGVGLGKWLAYGAMTLADAETTEYALYSHAGYHAFAGAHAIAVERASAAGLDVDAALLDPEPLEYPGDREMSPW